MARVFRNAFRRSVFNRALPYEHTNAAENAREIGRSVRNHLREHYNPRDPVFKRDPEGRTINNLWTGYTLGGKGRLAVAGGLLGGGTIVVSNPRAYQNWYNQQVGIPRESDMLNVESLPSTRGDALGYQVPLGPKASEYLHASGDLVFALHKTAHTGQL